MTVMVDWALLSIHLISLHNALLKTNNIVLKALKVLQRVSQSLDAVLKALNVLQGELVKALILFSRL